MLLDETPSGTIAAEPERYAWRGAVPRPSRGAYLAAAIREGWWSSLPGQAIANLRVAGRDRGELATTPSGLTPAERRERAVAAARVDPERVQPFESEADWRASDAWRPGLEFDPSLSRAAMRTKARIFDENAVRRDVMQRRDAGVVDSALGFGAAMLGTALDPVNFVPIAGPAWRAAQIARFGSIGGRAVVGASEAAVGNALVSPLVLASQARFGDDVGVADVALDVAMGAAIGSLFGAGSGLYARWRGRDATLVARQREQAAAARTLDEAATAIAEGRAPKVDPRLVAEVEKLKGIAARAESERLAAERRAEAATRQADAAGRMADVAPGAEVEVRAGADSTVTARVRYELVEADEVVTSHTDETFAPDPRFEARLQVRDRDRAAAIQQVRERASRLDPSQLMGSPLSSTGAPIVGPDQLVESGNGRVLSVRLAYREGMPGAEAYRATLRAAGFDVDGMRQPLLVRRRISELDDATRVRWTDDANRDVIERRSLTEEARADARLLTPEVTAELRPGALDGAANAPFVRAFIAALPDSEQAAMSTPDKRLSQEGRARLERAVQAAAYGDRSLVATLLESTDEATQRLGAVLKEAAPTVLRWRAAVAEGRVLPQLDGTDDLVAASLLVRDQRAAGRPLIDLLNLPDDLLGGGPSAATRLWLSAMLRRRSDGSAMLVAGDTLVARIARAAEIAEAAPQEADMFGAAPPTIRNVLATVHAEERIDFPYLPDAVRDYGDPPAAEPGPSAAAEPPPAPPRPAQAEAEADPVAATRPPPVDKAQFRQSQAGWSLDDVYARAEANDAELAAAIREIAGELGIEGKKGPIKKRETAAEKLERKKLRDAGALTDIVRGGFTLTAPDQAEAVLARLRQRFDVLDEGWELTDAGYLDRKALVRFGDGMVGEIQLWPAGMFEAKESGGHKLYEAARVLDEGDPERARLNDEMAALYARTLEEAGEAWVALSRSLGSGGSGPNAASISAGVRSPAVMATSRPSTSSQAPPGSSTANARMGATSTAGRPSQSANFGYPIENSTLDNSNISRSAVGVEDDELALALDAVDQLLAAGQLDETDLATLRQGNDSAAKAAAMGDALEAGLACLVRQP